MQKRKKNERRFKLVLPSPEWADEIADFFREFLETGSSADGQGPLVRMEDPVRWISWSRDQEKRDTCS